MRVLIDACLPVEFKDHFPLPEVWTARELGWQNLKNGDLLARADGRFDVLITMDRSLPSQQMLGRFGIAVIIVRAKSNRLPDLLPLVRRILQVLPVAPKGAATVVGSAGSGG